MPFLKPSQIETKALLHIWQSSARNAVVLLQTATSTEQQGREFGPFLNTLYRL